MEVIFHRLALAEYRKAIAHYRKHHIDTAKHFVRRVEDEIERIQRSPSTGSPCFGPYRWVRVKKFKYLLYYCQLTDTLTRVYAVAHAHRRPGYWLRRPRLP